MNWKLGLVRLWIVVSSVWALTVTYLASEVFLAAYPFSIDYQYVIQPKELPWETDWKEPFYENIYAPGKGRIKDTFAEIDQQYIEGFNKSVKDGTQIRVEFPDMSRLIISSNFTPSDRDLLSNMFWEQRWNRYFCKLAPWVGWAFGPPILLLLFAFTVAWVRRGFVRPPSAGAT